MQLASESKDLKSESIWNQRNSYTFDENESEFSWNSIIASDNLTPKGVTTVSKLNAPPKRLARIVISAANKTAECHLAFQSEMHIETEAE